MKMRIVKIGLALAGLGAFSLAQAAPAAPGVLQIKNRDGISFAARLKGDEHFHWTETTDGFVVVKNAKTGDFEYARISQGALVPTGVRPGVAGSAPSAANAGARLKAADPAFRALIKSKHQHSSDLHAARADKLLTGSVSSTLAASSAPTTVTTAGAVSAPPPGQGYNRGMTSKWNFLVTPPPTVPLLVIQLEYNDQQFRNPVSAWAPKIFGMAPGQMGHYWKSVSNGRFHFVPAAETQGVANDGVVRVKVAANHPNGDGNTEMLQALDQLDPFIDFVRFDTDRNGRVSQHELQLLFIHSGGEASSGSSLPSVWGKVIPETAGFRDGVEVEAPFALIGERHSSPPNDYDATIGIIAHELGHSAFSLPDLYDADGSTMGVGYNCLMGYGSWGTGPNELQGASPVALSAWGRYRLGMSDIETVVPGTPLPQTLKPQSRDDRITVIPTDYSEQYFLVENRYPEGTDIGLAGLGSGGAVIWHIDEFHEVNYHDDARIVRYKGDVTSEPFWPMPGRTSLTPASEPSSAGTGNTPTGVYVTGITPLTDADHSVSFIAEKRSPRRYPTMHVRGTSNNWGATPMQLVEPGVWEVKQTFVPGTVNPRFKLDVAGDWVTSFGDTNKDNVLDQGGADIAIVEPGTYRIRVWERNMTYNIAIDNRPPVANAGPDQVVFVDQPVYLDGSASTDVDGTVTWYRWSTGHDTAKITLSFSTPGTHVITLRAIDNHGGDDSDDVVIEVKARGDNLAPTARIAPVSGAVVGQPVVFDGSTSSDPDGSIASYSWTINGVAGTLSGVKPSYTFTAAGTYTVSLIVTDNAGARSTAASSTVNVAPSGFKKTYNQVYYRGTTNNWATDTKLTLSGDNLWSTTVVVPASGTQTFKFDINGDWTLNFGDTNADGLAEQGGGNIVFPAGGGTFALTFNDSTRRYTVVKQSSGNQAPSAIVAAEQTVTGAVSVNLDGSASKDADGSIASYQWTQVAGPTVTITNPAQALAKVSLPAVTTATAYRFRLTVTDNAGATASAEHTVNQKPAAACSGTYTQMGLRGTHNAWGVTSMTRAADCYWEATATFGGTTSERFKFDVSGNWATNFGDSNKDGIAEIAGADIAIGSAGSYRIRFDDVSKRYTVIKQ